MNHAEACEVSGTGVLGGPESTKEAYCVCLSWRNLVGSQTRMLPGRRGPAGGPRGPTDSRHRSAKLFFVTLVCESSQPLLWQVAEPTVLAKRQRLEASKRYSTHTRCAVLSRVHGCLQLFLRRRPHGLSTATQRRDRDVATWLVLANVLTSGRNSGVGLGMGRSVEQCNAGRPTVGGPKSSRQCTVGRIGQPR